MSGPPPKNPAIRQRQNRVSTRATLPAEGNQEREIPDLLPKRRRWHDLTRRWWEDTWRSPLASEYIQVDVNRLFVLALLIDKFWKKPSIALAVEIRLQGQCFGQTPIDRRRLQWEVEKVEQVTRRAQPIVQPQAPADDPRNLLRVVS